MIDIRNMIWVCFICFIAGACLILVLKDTIASDQPIKLSYTLRCENGKCDTTYKASTR